MLDQQALGDARADALQGAAAQEAPAHNVDLEYLATSVELTLASVLQGIALSLLIPKTVELTTSGQLAKVLIERAKAEEHVL